MSNTQFTIQALVSALVIAASWLVAAVKPQQTVMVSFSSLRNETV